MKATHKHTLRVPFDGFIDVLKYIVVFVLFFGALSFELLGFLQNNPSDPLFCLQFDITFTPICCL